MALKSCECDKDSSDGAGRKVSTCGWFSLPLEDKSRGLWFVRPQISGYIGCHIIKIVTIAVCESSWLEQQYFLVISWQEPAHNIEARASLP